jgi:Phage QLRG family, putative DNA packaging.
MAITNGYATLAQVKASLRITDTVDDDLLELAIESASREIDAVCERNFFSTAGTRIYTPRDSYVVEIDDVVSVTSVKSSGAADGIFDTTWTTSDYQLEPLNGIAGGIAVPYSFIRAVGDFTWPVSGKEATVQVVGTFGFASVPTAIKQATVILASRIFKRNDSPLGVAGFSDLGVIRVGRVDPDVEAMIHAYKKVRFA